MTTTTERSPDEIRAEIAKVPRWRHSIEVAPGISTPGDPTKRILRRIRLPDDLTGKSVLDVGCSDGFFSFEAERRGASRVVGFDEWSSPFVDRPAGFDTVHKLLNSKVEFYRLDLQTLDPAQLGQFDVVLCLGVLYHLKHPLLGLEQLAKLTKDTLILETEVTESIINQSGMRFIEGLYHGRDITTWWVPSVSCVQQMARAAGFQRVETITLYDTRAVFHCRKDPEQLRRNILASRPDELAAVLPPEHATAPEPYVRGLAWDGLWPLEQALVWNRSNEIAKRTRAVPIPYGAFRRILSLCLDVLRASKLRYR
jgi:tRNA (mo5U34)-methyltransferase